jgi:Skp family chaperone for outer membrane proteins
MDITQQPSEGPLTQSHQTADPGVAPSNTPIQTLIAAAIAEAQRTAREEYKKKLKQLTHKHQQETQALREELQQGTQSLRQDILTQA